MTTKMKNIILTGFMGTGKSTVGRLLAKKLGYEFADTDQLIEDKCGMSIPALFKRDGEQYFRQMEGKLAEELGGRNSLVISTGGGFMLSPANVEAIEKNGKVFCLVAEPEEILKRVLRDTGCNRPLLQVENPKERIIALLEERQAGYAQFPQIATSGRTPAEVVEDILPFL